MAPEQGAPDEEFANQGCATLMLWLVVVVMCFWCGEINKPQEILMMEGFQTFFFLLVSFVPQIFSPDVGVVNRSVKAARMSMCGPALTITVSGTCMGLVCRFMMMQPDSDGPQARKRLIQTLYIVSYDHIKLN